MLQMMDDARTPLHWLSAHNTLAIPSPACCYQEDEWITIGLVNNMPDAALEDTESQFFQLLNAAAADLPVRLQLFALPGIPRGPRGADHLNRFYLGINHLLNNSFDGLIITGTEPRQSDLRKEPYWGALTDLFQWAEQNTVSTILSCLAAHASVLHSDGISRHPMNDKKFGVFKEQKAFHHMLIKDAPERLRFPHSRWNEVRETDLASCGYTVLTKSADAGVNMFLKKKQRSLFVHFQGHPEYGSGTLGKEYRRDIKRFLRHERETYPSTPCGYFDEQAMLLLNEFRQKAVSVRHPDTMEAFPDGVLTDGLESSWGHSATRIYRNWLQYIAQGHADVSGQATAVRTVGA